MSVTELKKEVERYLSFVELDNDMILSLLQPDLRDGKGVLLHSYKCCLFVYTYIHFRNGYTSSMKGKETFTLDSFCLIHYCTTPTSTHIGSSVIYRHQFPTERGRIKNL